MKRYASIDRSVTEKWVYGKPMRGYGVDNKPNDGQVRLPVVGTKRVSSLEPTPDDIKKPKFITKW